MFSLLWSYLMRVRALQIASHITDLGDPTHSKWHVHSFPSPLAFLTFISSSIFHYAIYPCVYVLVLLPFFHSVSFIYTVSFLCLSIPQSIIIFTISCVFPFAFRSEPSHLLNHLVKFVSSGDLL